MEVFETRSVVGTTKLGKRLARRLGAGDCVALIGELGAGKTALVRGLVIGLGLEEEKVVSSPTFVLVQEYHARVPVYHLDLYRMIDPQAELSDLGLDEMLEDGVVLIEWADRADGALPRPRWQVQIDIAGKNSRRFEVTRIEE